MKKRIKCKWNTPESFIKTLNIAASETRVFHRCIGTGSKKTEQLGNQEDDRTRHAPIGKSLHRDHSRIWIRVTEYVREPLTIAGDLLGCMTCRSYA